MTRLSANCAAAAVDVPDLVLGVDPTATGTGAAELSRRSGSAAWWTWTSVAAGWRVRSSCAPEVVVPSLDDAVSHVGSEAARVLDADVGVVVEGLHVPPRWAKRAKGDDVLKLAEATGTTIAALVRAGLPVPFARPSAKEWRTPFGLATCDYERAEALAIEMAMAEGWLPRGLTAKEQGAVAEAGRMGRWARIGVVT